MRFPSQKLIYAHILSINPSELQNKQRAQKINLPDGKCRKRSLTLPRCDWAWAMANSHEWQRPFFPKKLLSALIYNVIEIGWYTIPYVVRRHSANWVCHDTAHFLRWVFIVFANFHDCCDLIFKILIKFSPFVRLMDWIITLLWCNCVRDQIIFLVEFELN